MNQSLRARLHMLILAIVGGFAIGIGGIVFLSIDIKIVGALMFTIGLYTICVHGLNLFTGKVGYLPERTPSYLLDLLTIWLGNLIGTEISALCVLGTRNQKIAELAKTMCETKLSDGLLSLFLLAIFCGFLMYVAVDGYAKTKNPILLFLGVATFILSGFEHCIADMFYFAISQMWSVDAFVRICVITLGNSLGGILIPLAKKLEVKA